MAWEFVITDLQGNVLGPANQASGRKVSLPHLRVPTCSFTVPVWSTLANTLLFEDCLVKCYRTDPVYGTRQLVFIGPTVSSEEDPTGGVAVNAAGPFWRLNKRLIGKSKAGLAFGNQDLGTTAHQILAITNAEGYTGIAAGTLTESISGEVGPWHNKPVVEAISELMNSNDSFEMEIAPSEPTDVGAGFPRIGYMNIEPVIGLQRPDVIFEYGTTKANLETYKIQVDREGLLTRAHIISSGWPDAADKEMLTASADNISTRGLFEELVNDAGVEDDTLRQSIVNFHVAIRQNPRVITTVTPVANARPSPISDFASGDTIRARAVVNGSVRFDQQFRIWGMSFDIDDMGNEKCELELVMPT